MNLNRRAFLAGLAAIAAPVFARLALPAPPERKLLGNRILENGRIRHGEFHPGHLYVSDGTLWLDCGEVIATELGPEPACGYVWGYPYVIPHRSDIVVEFSEC
jgi:hypothetical protein